MQNSWSLPPPSPRNKCPSFVSQNIAKHLYILGSHRIFISSSKTIFLPNFRECPWVFTVKADFICIKCNFQLCIPEICSNFVKNYRTHLQMVSFDPEFKNYLKKYTSVEGYELPPPLCPQNMVKKLCTWGGGGHRIFNSTVKTKFFPNFGQWPSVVLKNPYCTLVH